MANAKPYTSDLSMNDDAAILALWKLKCDTLEIAHRLKRPEWQIHNRLLHLRGQSKQGESHE